MTCKQCVHHEKFHDESFYCESINDLMEEDENFDAEQCRYFAPMIVEGDEAECQTNDMMPCRLHVSTDNAKEEEGEE